MIYGKYWHEPIRTMYFVGDNVCTDILGANLYHMYLSKRNQDDVQISFKDKNSTTKVTMSRRIDLMLGKFQIKFQNC